MKLSFHATDQNMTGLIDAVVENPERTWYSNSHQ